VIPDRIEMGTYMIAPAIAGGEVEIVGGDRILVGALI
jgi:UDP-N-acetylglucosamine 1-carboxyvinyltransferase